MAIATPIAKEISPAVSRLKTELDVALLTGGWDRPYAYGMTTALYRGNVSVDLVCGDDLDIEEFREEPRVTVLNIRREQLPGIKAVAKAGALLRYYVRLVRYAWSAQPRVFHILWNNKFETFDRVALMMYYRLLGKRVVLTAHNVNAGTRDATDSFVNRWTLRFQYKLCDHVFVHTEKMRAELIRDFGISESSVSVIPFGINNSVPRTPLTPAEARLRLGIDCDQKVILFFGNIAPYKGLEYLIEAFGHLSVTPGEYRLIVAGRPKKGFEDYWNSIRATMGDRPERDGLMLKIEYIRDEDTELYFKAADVLALPYTTIFQSGVLLLGYSFGLPVLASDVGSLKQEIVEGETGHVFPPRDSVALATAIKRYFASELYAQLATRRSGIQDYANRAYSWDAVADTTRQVYATLLRQKE